MQLKFKYGFIKYGLSKLIGFALLMISILGINSSILAQNNNEYLSNNKDQALYMFLDRNIYIVGEKIHIKLFRAKDNSTEYQLQSYIYCDLIGQDGNLVQSIKVKMRNGTKNTQILIPDYIKSGNYIIRAYSREMRNQPSNFSFLSIKIINPYSSDYLKQTTINANKLFADSIPNSKDSAVIIKLNKAEYSARELVKLSLNVDTNKLIKSSITISVAPKNSFINTNLSARNNKPTNRSEVYIEEKQGLIMSGSIINLKTNKPIPNEQIIFSILGTRDVLICNSDSLGRFRISLPDLYGNREVYISTTLKDDNALIMIDKDFDINTNYGFGSPFKLSKEEQDLALQLSRNIAVQKLFQKEVITEVDSSFPISFYNNADEIIIIDDYIELPKMHMYFTELPGSVHLRKEGENYIIRLDGKDGVVLLQEPLLLIDYVAINDFQSLLQISPKLVQRIEIVRSYYQKGDASFGGILNFITYRGDFGEMEFPSSSITVNYNFLNKEQNVEKFEQNTISPDARNTLFWLPKLRFTSSETDILFYTSDTPSIYTVVVQGLNKDMERVYYSYDFRVVD